MKHKSKLDYRKKERGSGNQTKDINKKVYDTTTYFKRKFYLLLNVRLPNVF